MRVVRFQMRVINVGLIEGIIIKPKIHDFKLTTSNPESRISKRETRNTKHAPQNISEQNLYRVQQKSLNLQLCRKS